MMAESGKTRDRTRVIFAGISALILTVGLSRFAYTPMLPIMHREANLSDLDGSWLATINYAGYMSGVLLAASIKDLSRKFLLYRAGLLIAVLSTIGMGLTQNFVLWAALRYAGGLSSIAGILLASGLVLNWLVRFGHRPELGVHFAGLGLGIVVSGLAVAAMVERLSWDEQWIGLGLIGLAFFIPAWWWMPRPLSAEERKAQPEIEAEPSTKRWMALFIAAYFCGGFGYVISATFIVAILEKLPEFAGRGGWVWVIVGLAATPSSFVWDKVATALGSIRALLLAYLLQAFAILTPALTESAAVNLAAAVIFGNTFVGIVSLSLTVIGRRFPVNPAKAMASLTLSYGVAQIAAPVMTGYVVTATGSYRDALVITSLVMAGGMVLLWAMDGERNTPTIQP